MCVWFRDKVLRDFDRGAAIREFSKVFEVDESTKEGRGVGAGKDCVEWCGHRGLTMAVYCQTGSHFECPLYTCVCVADYYQSFYCI